VKLVATPLEGAYVIEFDAVQDERGFFARTYCDEELRKLLPHIAQSSISFSSFRGTLRGMHYQRPPHEEAKIVRCSRGRIFDVIVDLRTARWFGIELKSDNRRMLFVPERFGHGFQALDDDTEVSYQISRKYNSDSASGFRWNDPAFAIQWPLPVTAMSDRDRSWPDFRTK
jgi:dTDP-4-dehydrorhamnose 3,5-epimerase